MSMNSMGTTNGSQFGIAVGGWIVGVDGGEVGILTFVPIAFIGGGILGRGWIRIRMRICIRIGVRGRIRIGVRGG